jgi:hypothetical protein
MCAAASTPWPHRSGIAVLDYDDIGSEPTLRAEVSFGQWTMPLRHGIPGQPQPVATTSEPFVKPIPRVHTPTPNPSASASEMMPTPMIAPPPSAARALTIGFTIGTSLGLAILGAAWHFFL